MATTPTAAQAPDHGAGLIAAPLIVLGGGEHARVVIDAARSQGDRWVVQGYVAPEAGAATTPDVPWLGDDATLAARLDDLSTDDRPWLVLGFGGAETAGALAARTATTERFAGRALGDHRARDGLDLPECHAGAWRCGPRACRREYRCPRRSSRHREQRRGRRARRRHRRRQPCRAGCRHRWRHARPRARLHRPGRTPPRPYRGRCRRRRRDGRRRRRIRSTRAPPLSASRPAP